jgi:hypothetical protein
MVKSKLDHIRVIERIAMRGVDGNYLNTQGDATARMQVAYQAEQNRQQIRAQMEASDTLRKLREQVNEAEKKDASAGSREVKDDQGSGSETSRQEEDPKGKSVIEEKNLISSENAVGGGKKTHIDIRV